MKIATKMIAIIGICYRSYGHYTLYRSCLPIYGIAIVRSLSFLFPDDYVGHANISVVIKSGVVYYGTMGIISIPQSNDVDD